MKETSRRILLAGSSSLLASPAMAQGRQTLLSENNRGTQILVIGDSHSNGLAIGLTWVLAWGVTVDARGIVNTGLARAEAQMANFGNWFTRLEELLRAAPNRYAAAVISLGSVDNQRLTFTDGREPLAFGSQEFAEAYAERMARLVAMLRAARIAPLWVGLPSAGSPQIDQAYAWIDALQVQAARRANIPYLHLRPLTLHDGRYDEKWFNGRSHPTSLRAPDALHFTQNGYFRIAEVMVPQIEAQLGGRRLPRR
jgi:hypothetical protein